MKLAQSNEIDQHVMLPTVQNELIYKQYKMTRVQYNLVQTT